MLLCLIVIGCKSTAPTSDSPQRTYEQIEKTFLSGNLLLAQTNAESALHRYAATDPSWAAEFRVELAKVRLYQGHSFEVVALLDSPLAQGASADSIVRQNLLLALAEQYLGEEELADRALSRAEALHPNGILQAEFWGAEGNVSLNRGELAKAETFLKRALEQAQVQNAAFLQVRMWNNLGLVAMQQEHYEDARARFDHASSIAQAIGARVALNYSLNNLGWIYYQTGDFVRALQNAQLAVAQAAAAGAGLDEVQALTNAGTIQLQSGDSAAALSSYKQAFTLAEALHNPEKLGAIHVALGYMLLHTDPRSAEGHIREAAVLSKLRNNPMEELEASLLEGLLLVEQGKRPEAETALLKVVKQAESSPWLRWKAENTLAELYAETNRHPQAEVWFERAIDTFHRQRDSVSSVEMQLPFFENGSDLYLSYMEYLIRQHRTDDALMVLDRSRAEMLSQGLHQAASGNAARMQQSTAQSVAAKLHGTILVYCLRPQRSYLWAIDGKREEFHELPGSGEILPLVKRHTEAILASKDLLSQQDAPGAALYNALIRPAQALLTPGGRVFLIADKDLGGLNFETLIAPESRSHYWIEDVSVTNARSLRLLATMDAPHPKGIATQKQKMLLIGDPFYRQQEYAPLPNAAAEMKGVASHFDQAERTVFAGKEASPATYDTSDAKKFAYIHFVAHATADAINPLDSAIILSNSGDRLTPYKLYAADILKQPLNAELVTLSSCYGSGVRNYSGEGVVGLVWAFLRAGAHSVIGAMWEVSDVSTPQLMDSLYGELLRGAKPDAALRSAKLTMVHQGGVFRKPLYWASFQLYAGR